MRRVLCRDVGPVQGERTIFFGHARKAPKPSDSRRDRPFDPQRDVIVGNIVAILMSDEDALQWARTFDIARITKVLAPDPINGREVRQFEVQYYACKGVEEGCDPEYDPEGRFRSEEVQLNMQWVLTTQQHIIPWTAIINEQWVYGNGLLHVPWREALRRELCRLHSTDPGDM